MEKIAWADLLVRMRRVPVTHLSEQHLRVPRPLGWQLRRAALMEGHGHSQGPVAADVPQSPILREPGMGALLISTRGGLPAPEARIDFKVMRVGGIPEELQRAPHPHDDQRPLAGVDRLGGACIALPFPGASEEE